MKRFLLAAAMLLAAGLAHAQNSGDITVQSVWARATPPGAPTGVVYMVLANHGASDDKLVGVSTPVAAKAGLHVELMANGVMKMRMMKAIDLKPGAQAVLQPGGMHVMLTGLKQALKQGGRFPITLQFAHAPPLTVQVKIAKIGASSIGDMGSMGGHDMNDMDDMKH
jgi:hypothetical protein